jgi:hypothetical protein
MIVTRKNRHQLYAVITMKCVKTEQAITGNTQAADVLRNICIMCSYEQPAFSEHSNRQDWATEK